MLQIRRWTDSPIAFGVAGNRLLFLAESDQDKVDEELLAAYIEQKQPVWAATVTDALSDNDPLGVSAILMAHINWTGGICHNPV